MTQVRAVVFDVGGVLLDWDPRHLYRSLIADEEQLEPFLAEVCTPAWNAELDAGRSFEEACAALSQEHPECTDLIDAWTRQSEMIRGEVPGTPALVERLDAGGVPLLLLTNMPRWVFDERRDAYPVLQRFAGAVVSGDHGILKPDPAIFRLVLDQLGHPAEETLFIDDAEVNVASARSLGFVTHRFVDAPTLERHLEELELL